MGLLVNAVSCFFLPPIFGEPPGEWWTVVPGLMLCGFSQGMAILPQIPELKMQIMFNNFT
jgi:hypothetical protein